MKKLLNMDKKKLIIIIASILILIILLLCLRSFIDDKNFKEMVENKDYTKMGDFQSVREVLVYMKCEYIKEEESKDKEYSKNIYLKFAKDLYENGESSEGFYTNLVCYVANVLKYENYKLVDKEKNIYISVICNKEEQKVSQMIINGDASYFAHNDSKNALSKYKKIQNVDLEIKADIINECIQKQWNTSKITFGTKESKFNYYDIYFDEGLEVRNVGTKIFNIVFTDRYEDEILKDIKVGMKFDDIKNVLGDPTFEENTMIGYKSKDIYIFFSENQVSVYRVENFTDDKFAEFLDKEKEETDINKIVNDLTDIWPDYDERTDDENGVSITYSLKGVKFEYGMSDNNGITIYSNYLGNIANGKNIENIQDTELQSNIYINTEEDLVKNIENKRLSDIISDLYICSMTDQSKKEICLDTSSNEFDFGFTQTQKGSRLFFYDKNNNYPKFEVEGNITTFIWIDDYNVIYNIENKGLYLLNLKDREKKTLIEGEEKYEIKQFNENNLIYDDNKTLRI